MPPPAEIQRNLIQRVNVGDSLTRTAARRPHALALADGERRLTYAQFNAQVNRFANALAGRGYRPGDALALASGNSIEFLVTYYACAKLGVVCVPINLGWRSDEVACVLGHSHARGIVAENPAHASTSRTCWPASEGTSTLTRCPRRSSWWTSCPGPPPARSRRIWCVRATPLTTPRPLAGSGLPYSAGPPGATLVWVLPRYMSSQMAGSV